MKKIIGTLALAAVATASLQPAMAGDREWATAGKVLTGVFAGSILAHALTPAPTVVYTAPPPTYYAPTVVAVPQQVIATAPTVADAPVVTPVVVQQTAPVYVQPAPVVVYQQPVYVRPAPVYAPIWIAPRPAVSFHFGFGGGYHHHHRHHHRRW